MCRCRLSQFQVGTNATIPTPSFLQVDLLDGNANNQMDSDDFNIWRANFGNTTGSGSLNFPPPIATVPELASLILALLRLAAAELAFHIRHLG